MIRFIFFFLLAGFTAVTTAAAVTVNSLSHTNYTGYVIAADASISGAGTDRDEIAVEANVSFGSAAVYRLDWSLLDPSGTAVATATTTAASRSGTVTVAQTITPSAVNRLVPGKLYRVKVDVVKVIGNTLEATFTETTGQTFIHFIGTSSGSDDLNVVSEITAITVNRDYLLESNSTRITIPVRVDYTLHRFDDWSGTNTAKDVALTFGGQWLRNSDGAVQAVTVSGNTKTESAMGSFDASASPIAPKVVTGFKIIQVDPAAILAPDNYRASVTITHTENTVTPSSYTGNTMDSASTLTYHFTGQVNFGSGPIMTHVTDIGGAPGTFFGALVTLGTSVECTITPAAGSGTVDGVSGYTFGGSTIQVVLTASGIAQVRTAWPGTMNLDPVATANRSGVLNGVDFQRTGTAYLNATGAHSEILAFLPAGIGWAADKVTGLLNASVAFGTQNLNQSLMPSGTLTITPGAGAFYLCEETKPVYIEAAVFSWLTSAGEFQCGAVCNAHSIRKPLLDFLSSYAYADPSLSTKRSNDHLYNTVTTAANISVKKGVSNGAQITGDVNLSAGSLVTHFPYDTSVVWASASVMHIAGDIVNPAGSQLNAPSNLVNAYNQHCTDEIDCTGARTENVTLTPAGALSFTGDGGLYAGGAVTQTIEWGYNGIDFTHQVNSTFTDAHFLMAGTFLRGDQNLLNDEDGPANILLSGFDPANLTVAERPQTTAYSNGLGDYAGINFRCSSFTSPLATASSRLQGSLFGPYNLTTRSKYYTRLSGVTGIHESPTGPGGLTLAGYLFNLTTFGCSFLSSEMEDSRISGELDIITPNNFTLDFNELRFSCLGSLDSFELGSGSSGTDCKEFDLWNALFTPLAVSFVDSSACGASSAPGTVTMKLGFTAHASHFAAAFEGSLGIEYNGHFAKYSDHMDLAVPTRLTLPSALTMTGASGEEYTFFPAEGAYFNDNPASGTGDGEGFWSLFGTLDVPFFEDMRVHLQTRAGFTATGGTAPEIASPLYMTGGWMDTSSQTAFDVDFFDSTHTGHPVALATYRDQRTTTYLPHAEKLWLGVIDFDYPVVWSSTSFDFRGFEAQTQNLLVLSTEHQLDFMDEKTAEISFGVQYSGLPEINLASMAFNALDEATGVSSALVTAAGNEVFTSLSGGVDSFTDMLSDKAEDLIGDLLDQAVDDVLDDFLAEVKTNTPAGAKINAGVLSGVVDRYFRDPTSDAVKALSSVSDTTALTQKMIADFKSKLDLIEDAIDAVTVGLNTDADPEIDSYGLLAKYVPSGGTEAERVIFLNLASALIDTLATVASSTELGDKIREVLAEIEPQLEAAQNVLLEIKTAIGEVRAALNTGGELADEITNIVNNATTQIEAASDAAGDYAEELVLAMTVEDQSDIDAIIVEWKAQIAQRITDEIFESQFVTDIQEAIKEKVYDLQAAFNQAVDTAFAALNTMIRQAMSEVLAGLDETINDNFVGDVQNYLGSGSLTGYAHINGDSLDELRIDATFKMEVPDAMELAAYLQIKELDSDGATNAACCGGATGANITEVSIGALDVGLGWTGVSGEELRADLGVKFSLNSSGLPIGLGGSFEMTSGEISFETFKITELGASVMFGATENYLAAKIGVEFGEYQMAGGVFFGHACSLDPLLMVDPLVASVLTMTEFTGVYCYGEATFPVYGTGTCLFNISAKAGAGVFYFTEGPTYGGRLTMGVYGEALCAVEIGGEVSLVGLKSGDDYAFAGSGRLYGKAGVCKFCLEADLRAQFEYTDQGGWEVSY
ncbi:MAG: hypothetical protein ACKVY0_01110 [Prosthecobacter sp.]|uniref:hypothetical protein n=1 Tax=Prosthecobacter sp. TaxID=1965333 RepID=UPI003900A4B7